MQASPLLRIRPGMDVFDAYQRHFIGSVIRVWYGEHGRQRHGFDAAETEHPVSGASITHEEGNVTSYAPAQGRRMMGEEMGPVPTASLGNSGPARQSTAREYATETQPGDEGANVVYFAVRPGRINLGPLTPSLYIPTSAVRSISMERVVLAVEGDSLPEEWRRRPTG